VVKVTLVQLNNYQGLLGKEGKSLPGSPPALSMNELINGRFNFWLKLGCPSQEFIKVLGLWE
jgi:hypothetical protein